MKKTNINSVLSLVLAITFLSSSCSVSLSTNSANSVLSSTRSVANSSIDNILEEFNSYFESQLSESRRQEIKIVQENLIKYLIEATHSDESYKKKIFIEATNYFNKIYPVLLDNIRNEKVGKNQFQLISKAPIWTLKDELQFLNDDIKKYPEPKVRIDLLEGLKLLAPFYKKLNNEQRAKISDNYNLVSDKIIGNQFNLHPSFNEIESIIELNGSDDQKISRIIDLVETKISKHEQSIRHIGTEMTRSGQFDMKNNQIRLVVTFMDYYFNKLPDDVIKTIMSELVTSGPKRTEETVMGIVFQNTGPGLGKLLQQMGKQVGIGEKFSKLMEVLESSGKQVPYHLVKKVVEQDKGGFDIKTISEKPLGTGTIAQVNKAILNEDNQEKEIALRLLKPGIEKRCIEDIAILRKFLPDNEVLFKAEGIEDTKIIESLIDGVEKFLADEVDLGIAVERQKMANEIYTRSVKIKSNAKVSTLEMKVPAVYLPPNGKSNLHIQEFVSGGVKFSDLTDVNAKKIVAEEMLRMWFEEALFKSGFLNADLHQGNFRVVLIEENNKIKVLLYDFGLSSVLTKEEQRSYILVGAGAYLKAPTTIAEGLLISMNNSDKNFRANLIKNISEELKINPNKSAEDWVAWCVQKNYFVSDKLGAFARGSILLKQLPESIGETEMFSDVVTKSAVKHLVKSIADRNYDYPLKKIDIVKLSAARVKNSCLNVVRLFFKQSY